MNRNLLWSLLLSGLALGAWCLPAHGADQPQWGQAWSRNMVSDERGLPDSFDPQSGRNIQWSAELGTETHSSPVVAGGRVYIGTNNGHPRDPAHQGDRGVLMCFDEKTGRFLWQLVFPKRDEDIYFDWPHSGISSPVTVEGDRVYFVNNRGVVLCLDVRPAGREVRSPKSEVRNKRAAERARPEDRLGVRPHERRRHLVARCRPQLHPDPRRLPLPEHRHRRGQHPPAHSHARRAEPGRARQAHRPPRGPRRRAHRAEHLPQHLVGALAGRPSMAVPCSSSPRETGSCMRSRPSETE